MNTLPALLTALSVLQATPVLPVPPPQLPPIGTWPVKAYLTTDRLYAICAVPDSDTEGYLESCLGYLAGTVDQLLVMDALSPTPSLCAPPDFQLGALRTAFLERVRAHPEERPMPASVVVDVVIVGSFRCSGLADRRK